MGKHNSYNECLNNTIEVVRILVKKKRIEMMVNKGVARKRASDDLYFWTGRLKELEEKVGE